MIARHVHRLVAAMLLAVPAALARLEPYTCPTNDLLNLGRMSTWVTKGKTWPRAIPVEASSSFIYFPDGCGNGGQVGVRFYQGGPNPGTQFNTASFQDYNGSPTGANPDQVMSAIFGTFEQKDFKAEGPIQSIRIWENSGSSFSFVVEMDYTKSDCTNFGAPQAGATYAGSFVGFSDYWALASPKTTMTVTATKVGGAAGSDYSNWELFNSDQGSIGGTGAVYLQEYAGSASSGVLQGTGTPAPGGNNPYGSSDANLSLVTLSNKELYTTLKIVVSTVNGANDYIGFIGGSIVTACPPGTILGDDGYCYPCPPGTFADTSVTPAVCSPCKKGLTTFGCGAASVNACHKACGAGLYWDAARGECRKCPAGTYWPMTHPYAYETDTCLPCDDPVQKLGMKTCRSAATNSWKAPKAVKTKSPTASP